MPVKKVGRYEILGELAIGGMAEILLGRLVGPSGFERVVVLKRILPHLTRAPAFVQMFLDEARTVARIRHPNVVQVHELGSDDGELYLVMEYLEGESVAGLLRRLALRDEKLDPWLAAHVVAEACRGLHAAHELTDGDLPLDLVHRDVSPQNIFVTYSGAVKVLDFGIAKAADGATRTEAGQVKGKFAYMSPEQCAGKPLDRRSDLFALGAVLYELLTKRRLFKRATELLTMKAICEQPVAPPGTLEPTVPAALEAACMHALARRRDERPRDAAEMRREVLAAMRALGREGDAEEALAALMHRLFAERIAEKAEMLRKATALRSVTHVPSAESDGEVELAAAEEPTAMPTASDTTAPRPSPSRAWLGLAAAGFAAAIGAAWFARRAPERPAGPLTAPASAAPPETRRDAPAPAEARSAAPASDVALHVESTPPGARVTFDGNDLGPTPLDTRVPRGSEPREMVLTRPGYHPLEKRLTPDVDQRWVLALEAQRRTPRPAPARTAIPAIEKLP
jgi:eukaryotic-like serine/threonine-protein kinase